MKGKSKQYSKEMVEHVLKRAEGSVENQVKLVDIYIVQGWGPEWWQKTWGLGFWVKEVKRDVRHNELSAVSCKGAEPVQDGCYGSSGWLFFPAGASAMKPRREQVYNSLSGAWRTKWWEDSVSLKAGSGTSVETASSFVGTNVWPRIHK